MRRKLVGAAGVAVLLVSLVGVNAIAATSNVPAPAGGKVAGEGYAYYLQRAWQSTFSSGNLDKSSCRTLTINGQKVTFVTGRADATGKHAASCTVPAGRPVYAEALSNECSTLSGDHAGYGTADADLVKCARGEFKGGTVTASINGQPVDLSKLGVATAAYPIHIPSHNGFGIKATSGRSAAYGYGMLFSGFAQGTYKIHTAGDVPAEKFKVSDTATLHVS